MMASRLSRQHESGLATFSVAIAAAGRDGRDRSRGRGGRSDRGKPGSSHEEVLEALAGHLAGPVADEGVQQVAVVGDLTAVRVVDSGLAAWTSAATWSPVMAS